MSNIDTMPEITATNQDLFVDLNEKDAEVVSGGGKERFTIYNQTNVRIPYTVDGKRTGRPYGNSVWTAYKGGIIEFDYDFGRQGVQSRKYNLANGGKYAFRYNRRTGYSKDIELYRIG